MSRAATTALVVALSFTACSADDDASTTIRVLAASSLTDVFEALADGFEATEAGRGVNVELVFAGSSALAAQLEEGAPADAVALANEPTMARVEASGRLQNEPMIFAENALVIAVHPSAADDVRTLDDLASDELLVAICADQVPCGALSNQLLAAAGIDREPTSAEPNVRAVLTKVLLGEVDAGLVYATDIARSLPDELVVRDVALADSFRNRYPIATLSAEPAAAAFTAHVLSPAGAETLGEFGFLVSGR